MSDYFPRLIGVSTPPPCAFCSQAMIYIICGAPYPSMSPLFNRIFCSDIVSRALDLLNAAAITYGTVERGRMIFSGRLLVDRVKISPVIRVTNQKAKETEEAMVTRLTEAMMTMGVCGLPSGERRTEYGLEESGHAKAQLDLMGCDQDKILGQDSSQMGLALNGILNTRGLNGPILLTCLAHYIMSTSGYVYFWVCQCLYDLAGSGHRGPTFGNCYFAGQDTSPDWKHVFAQNWWNQKFDNDEKTEVAGRLRQGL